MVEVKLIGFGNGSINYRGKIEAVPATSETTGNVTVNNAGRDAVPAHFETSFMLSAQVDNDGLIANSTFHWNDVVLSETAEVSYRSIEDAAARRIAPALRALADKIEEEIARFDGEKQRGEKD